MDFKNSKTKVNLMASFAGESQARTRYTIWAKIARKAGLVQIANVFDETSAQEYVHAKTFYKFLNNEGAKGEEIEITGAFPAMLGDTIEHLKSAVAGEFEEHSDMYPEFAKVAEEEGYTEIARVFRNVAKVEAFHEKRFQLLLDRLNEGTLFERDGEVYWKCNNCGFVVKASKAPLKCPACDHPQGYFETLPEEIFI